MLPVACDTLGMGQATRLAVLVVLAVACSASGADERVIRYANDAVSLHVTRVPLREVLDDIARQTGTEVHGGLRAPHEVSAEFDTVPLPEALHRLLGDQNFTLVYGAGGQLRALKLLGGPADGKSAEPSTAKAAASAPQPASAAAPTPGSLAALLAKRPPIPVTGPLAKALGSSEGTLPQLFSLGVHDENATIRAEAVRTLVNAIEVDPTLRSAVISQVTNMDDEVASQFLRGAAGKRAEELASQVMRQARVSELRLKAASVLLRLQAGS